MEKGYFHKKIACEEHMFGKQKIARMSLSMSAKIEILENQTMQTKHHAWTGKGYFHKKIAKLNLLFTFILYFLSSISLHSALLIYLSKTADWQSKACNKQIFLTRERLHNLQSNSLKSWCVHI